MYHGVTLKILGREITPAERRCDQERQVGGRRRGEGGGVLAFALAVGGAGKEVVARQGLGWLGATPQAASGSTSVV